jgi:DNA-binding response OmpR family regulator
MHSVLIADDDRSVRAAIQDQLSTLPDLEIHQAQNGAEALRMLGERTYDALILDLQMPLIDGWVVLRTLRSKQGPSYKTPVYAISSDPSEHTRAQAMSMGAVFFMAKPVSTTTLLAVISGELRRASRNAERLDKIAAAKAANTPPKTKPQ